MRSARVFKRLFSRWKGSETGNVAIIAALMMPVIIGFTGMGVETGYWFYKQRLLQGAADIAAYNAVVALRNAEPMGGIVPQATTDASNNGWRAANGTIQVNLPPTSGAHQNGNSAEVIVTDNEQRLFTKMFSATPVQIYARSVATYSSSGQACMLALNKTASQAVRLWGNNATTLNGCNIMSDSFAPDAVAIGGSATVTAPCVLAVGQVSVSATLNLTTCATVTNNSAPAADPYKNLPTPPIPNNCSNVPGGNAPIQPGRYCGGITVNGTKTFKPGVYIIDGGTFKLNANAIVDGAGVTFYLTNGATVQFNGSAHMTFSGPTNGTYSGILFFGDPTQPNAIQKFNGDGTSLMTGAIYFPSQQVEMNGNFTGVNGCLQVIADTINYTGNANFGSNCAAQGMNPVKIPGGVSLVE
jgi:Flp pilus assembly protein TadG